MIEGFFKFVNIIFNSQNFPAQFSAIMIGDLWMKWLVEVGVGELMRVIFNCRIIFWDKFVGKPIEGHHFFDNFSDFGTMISVQGIQKTETVVINGGNIFTCC